MRNLLRPLLFSLVLIPLGASAQGTPPAPKAVPPPETTPAAAGPKSGPRYADVKDPVERHARQLADVLCTILMKGNERGFRGLLHSSLPANDKMHYWWNASSKGKHFANLFSECKFAKIVPKRTKVVDGKIQVLRFTIARGVHKKSGIKTSPGPVEFHADPKRGGKLMLYTYSL